METKEKITKLSNILRRQAALHPSIMLCADKALTMETKISDAIESLEDLVTRTDKINITITDIESVLDILSR